MHGGFENGKQLKAKQKREQTHLVLFPDNNVIRNKTTCVCFLPFTKSTRNNFESFCLDNPELIFKCIFLGLILTIIFILYLLIFSI